MPDKDKIFVLKNILKSPACLIVYNNILTTNSELSSFVGVTDSGKEGKVVSVGVAALGTPTTATVSVRPHKQINNTRQTAVFIVFTCYIKLS